MIRRETSGYVRRLGEPGEPAMLLLHGGGVGGWMWQPLIDQLGPGHRLLVPDLPGHDHSAETDYRSHDATVELLADLVESEGDGSVTAVGFSLGAQLAVLLAARRPDLVDRAMIISAQAEPMRHPGPTLALLRASAPLARNARFARAQAKELFIPESLLDDYLRTSRQLSTATLVTSVGENIRFVVPEEWHSWPGTVQVLVGGTERAMMQRSAQLFARGHGEAEVVDGCGHGIPLQRPNWLAERLRTWQ